jgi:hypothetical protein
MCLGLIGSESKERETFEFSYFQMFSLSIVKGPPFSFFSTSCVRGKRKRKRK